MAAPNRDRAKEIFGDALATSRSEREAFLDEACAGEAEVRMLVEGLLAAHAGADEFLASPTVHRDGSPETIGGAPAAPSADEAPGAIIGRYRLLRRIGEGGFGSVHLAEQTQPVTRRVALKVIKLGMDTQRVVARFEAERQALAMMEHPAIASVLDAGATESGRPYFVMEYVSGDPITDYCTRKGLDLEARLRLFERVCLAVQHAHQKGVIHRDLKPSNVLVTQVDGEPLPKVIDFGVAKAIEGRLSDQTIVTEERSLLGTPSYMSPEQASMAPGSVDTRSDVYSLGVLLYEMLTDQPPFEHTRLRDASFSEFQRILAEETPRRPSTRLQERRTGRAAEHEAARQERLRRRIRGDLDWIVLRALEKERSRRYQSAGSLAAEIGRFLRGEPVEAGPPTARYRAWKFVSRHRVGVSAAALVVVAVVAGGVAASLGLVEARRANQQMEAALDLARSERDRAVEAEQAADAAAELAERQAAIATAVNEFLNEDLLGAASPEELGRDVTMIDAVRAAVERLDASDGDSSIDSPEVEAAVRVSIGTTLRSLGEYDDSAAQLERAVEMVASLYGDESDPYMSALAELGNLRRLEGKQEEALAIFERVLAWTEEQVDAEPNAVLTARGNLATVLFDLGRYTDAAPQFESLYKARVDLLGAEHIDTLSTRNNLAMALMQLGNLDDARPHLEGATEGRKRVLGDRHPRTLVTMTNLGQLYRRMGRLDEAAAVYEESLAGKRDVFGPEHPETLLSINNLSLVLLDLQRYGEAQSVLEELLSTQRRVLGDTHWQTCSTMVNLARVHKAQESWELALPLNQEAVTGGREGLPEGHWLVGAFLGHLGVTLMELQRFDEAEATLLEAHDVVQARLGSDHPRTRAQVQQLARLYARWGREDEASSWSERLPDPP